MRRRRSRRALAVAEADDLTGAEPEVDEALGFDDLVGQLSAALRRDLGDPPRTTPLVDGLGLDELELCLAVEVFEALNPSFHLPPDCDVFDVTLADVHFYCQHMTPENHA